MSAPDESVADVVAAGGVLWRPSPIGPAEIAAEIAVEIAVAHRPRYDDWTLPKGKLDRGETPALAAVRELAEETGFAARLGPRLGTVHYQVPEGLKVVHYWSARAGNGKFRLGTEVDELRWLAPPAAKALLSYPHDREVLGRFLRLPVTIAPLLLVRHAKAGKKGSGPSDDTQRPLSRNGRIQAERLAALLALFGPSRIYSAPPVRCVQTAAPLAERLGVPVRIEPLLGEDGYLTDPAAGVARLLELASEPGVAAVCSQGGVIPDLVGRLTGADVSSARKASTWVLGLAGERAVTGDYYPPPA